MKNPKDGKLFYHLTHIENMCSIYQMGLMPRKLLGSRLIKDTANRQILQKRRRLQLEEFVPFHFYVRNPYDWAVCRVHGVQNMVIIAVDRVRMIHCFPVKIIPTHPAGNSVPELFDYDEGLEFVNWEVMNMTYTNDATIKKDRMAEVVIQGVITPDYFRFIYVNSIQTKAALIARIGFDPGIIQVNENMFPKI